MKLLERLNALFDQTINLMFYISSVITMVIFVSVCFEIFMRYFFNRPQIWPVEVTEYSMLYLTFLGAAWLLREEGHVSLDAVLVLMKPRVQAWLGCLTSILGMGVCLIIILYGARATWLHYLKGLRTFSAMEILKWPFLLVIPFGSLLLFVQFARRAGGFWRRCKSCKTGQ